MRKIKGENVDGEIAGLYRSAYFAGSSVPATCEKVVQHSTPELAHDFFLLFLPAYLWGIVTNVPRAILVSGEIVPRHEWRSTLHCAYNLTRNEHSIALKLSRAKRAFSRK